MANHADHSADDFHFGFSGFVPVDDTRGGHKIVGTVTVRTDGLPTTTRLPFGAHDIEYQICQRRGHQPSGRKALSCPPWDICKHCGAYYRYEQVLREL